MKTRIHFGTWILSMAFALGLSSINLTADEEIDLTKLPLPLPKKVDFEKEIYPLFKDKCFSCHGPEKQKGKYRIDTKEGKNGAFKVSEDFGPFIIKGNSEKSPLIHMMAGLVDEMLMPPPSDKPGESVPLTAQQIGLVRSWIDQGAQWPDGPIKDYVKDLSFEEDILPIFKAAGCFECHGPDKQEGGFRADSKAAVLEGGEIYADELIVPGQGAKSPLSFIIAGKDADMPLPEKHKLSLEKQIEAVTRWIDQGAK